MTRLWDKGQPLDERILRFTAGEDHHLDERLVEYDVRASIAHARMLESSGLLGAGDCTAICDGLGKLAAEHRGGPVVHRTRGRGRTRGTRAAAHRGHRRGPGGRVHLGRSRNDQVLAALRLYMKDAAEHVAALTDDAIGALERVAADQGRIALPGYTHMQPAMPSSGWTSGRAVSPRNSPTIATGLLRARARADLNPLGSAAGYGVAGLPLDREATAGALGFAATQEPVTAVQLSRGKAEAALIFELALLVGDLGRLASDLLLFYTDEFAYVSLPVEMTTGSSIMPQKRNPDVFELVRGRTGDGQRGVARGAPRFRPSSARATIATCSD